MREPVITPSTIADPKTKYGNAKSSTRHFFTQRLTGAINILFTAFLIYIVISIAGEGREGVVSLLGNPVIGIVFAILFAIVCVHMRIGMREIIEDYVHEQRTNRLSLSLNSFFAIAVGVVGVLSVLKLVFWG
ncbi:succinate dehydrogenase, hydrophobic membrane anchor protein [Devosia pacifica]|uniref:Succinate dehydrogenase hydrophobic membrane anchor subunit n=1 Tax=Devosia pacifica TaxID=1335967 RepID=A0A918S7A2_9HYPH|nr:succinate dehydrogenase, hydrophobic membrane anchor protein [Devosia pacifica]GHA24546.1 succinate dehydrogenase, hydrophobic membrane anchor protein [Devosia pacifica]